MTVSIHDVAKRAGVSIATVSRVVNQSAGVSKKKVAAVEEAMSYYNYQPSQFGRGLVTGNSNLIGVYSISRGKDMFSNGYMLECLRGISEEIGKSHYGMVLLSEADSLGLSELKNLKFSDYIHQNKIDGLISLTTFHHEALFRELGEEIDKGFPIAYIGRKFHEGGINVYAGYNEYMDEAVNILYRNGHRNIIHIPRVGLMSLTFKTKMEQKYTGLRIGTIRILEENGLEELKNNLEKECRAYQSTAILCEDINSVLKIQNVLNLLGYEIGKNISMISVEHVKDQGQQMYPPISCFYVPAFEIGKTIADMMLQTLKGEPPEEKSRNIESKYIPRGSVIDLNK